MPVQKLQLKLNITTHLQNTNIQIQRKKNAAKQTPAKKTKTKKIAIINVKTCLADVAILPVHYTL